MTSMHRPALPKATIFGVVAMAIGATKYVEQMAENILKMIEMAKQGWAATGNAPFGTDLVCYPLHDLCRPLFRVIRTRYIRPHGFRILYYTADSRVTRDESGIIVAHILDVAKEEESERCHRAIKRRPATARALCCRRPAPRNESDLRAL